MNNLENVKKLNNINGVSKACTTDLQNNNNEATMLHLALHLQANTVHASVKTMLFREQI